MNKIIAIIVVIIIVLGGGIALVKHSDNNTKKKTASTSTSSTAPKSTGSTASTSTAAASDQTSAAQAVTISNFAFSPATLTIKKGTTVTWTNKDSVAHTVTETDGQAGPKSSDLNQGQSYSFTFNTAGTFKYECSVHPNMTASVTVTD